MCTIASTIQLQASAHTSWCTVGNPNSPLTSPSEFPPKLIDVPTSSKYIQKLRDHIKWAHKKADLFQQKKAQCHKWNYDRCCKAVSFRMGDMAIVCVTAFKGMHKIQSRLENKEYVVEQQPYLNLPVYMVCPIDGEGHSHTLQRNYLLPISNNLEQGEWENSVGGDGHSDKLTPMPYMNDALLVDCLTKSQLESMPNSPSNSAIHFTQDQPGQSAWIPQIKGSSWQWYTCSTKAKFKNDEEPTPMEILEFCIMAKWHPSQCLHYLVWLMYLPSHHLMCAHCLHGEYSVKTLFSSHSRSAQHKQFLISMGIPSM